MAGLLPTNGQKITYKIFRGIAASLYSAYELQKFPMAYLLFDQINVTKEWPCAFA